MLVLRNCKLVKVLTEGTDLREADILIDGEYIKDILPPGTKVDDAEEINMNGRTIMPGLIDAHVHLFFGRTNRLSGEVYTAASRSFDCMEYASYLLSIGITTVRDCGDDINYPAVALRDAIKKGKVKGPRLQCSGPLILPPYNGIGTGDNMCLTYGNKEDLTAKVRYNELKGADFVKLYGSGSMIMPGSNPHLCLLTEDEIKAAVEFANMRDTYVAVHCHGTKACDQMFECGVRTIEHASFISEETLQKMDGRTDVGVVLTQAFFSDELLAADGYDEESIKRVLPVREKVHECVKKVTKYDVLVGMGTDYYLTSYKAEPRMELKVRKRDLGFSDVEILKQATINNAKLMKWDDRVGTVKVGKYADLITVNGDPSEDITRLYELPEFILKGGDIIKNKLK